MDALVTPGRILSLALPALGVLSAMPLYLLLDTAIIGHLGSSQLAALAAGTTVQAAVTTNLTFLSYGTTARAARMYGAGRRGDAVAEGVQATWLGLAVGFVLATLVWLFAPQLASFFVQDADTAAAAVSWMRVAVFAIPLTLIIMAGNGWMRGVHNTRLPFYFTLCGVIPGAIALPFFVDKLGLVGSAWANVLGMALTSVGFIAVLVREQRTLGFSWAPNPSVILRQLVLGRDLIVRSLSLHLSFILAAAVAGRIAVVALAAHQVLLQLFQFLSLVLDSLAIAAQALTGAALGKGDATLARKVGEKATVYSAGFAVALAAVLLAGGPWIKRIFTTDDAVIDAMQWPWLLLIVIVIAGGVLFALDGVLLGAGDAAFLRTLTVAAVFAGFLPGVAAAWWFDAGLTGIWCGLAAMIILRLIGDIWRFYSMRWAVGDQDSEDRAKEEL
ncbi:MATE family efflux transporter [Corynebacterium aquatimens]|uniref:MATE family efflux transporter n=1 Tax=Corynebacterium aquatimens TaxID=1190508 RepID=UPI0025B2ADEF|nr:MATE family efflux transporter [Corynebacterium aquatimens]